MSNFLYNIIKTVKLDYLLGKKSIKYYFYFILISILLALSNSNIILATLTTMTLISFRGINLIFQCEERCDIDRLYSFIPIEKFYLVIGRFIYSLLIGFFILLVTIIPITIIFSIQNINIDSKDLLLSFLLGITIYIINISIQIPGYYKLGTIKGAFFSYIPLILFLIFTYLVGGLDNIGINSINILLNNILFISIVLLITSIIIFIISIVISISINNKLN